MNIFSHVTLGTNNLDRAVEFYDAVLSPLGLVKDSITDNNETVGWSWAVPQSWPSFFVVLPIDEQPASVGNGTMVAFSAESSEVVDAAYQAGLKLGGQSEGEPGQRAQYGPGIYYGAYLRDLDGNKLHIVYRASE